MKGINEFGALFTYYERIQTRDLISVYPFFLFPIMSVWADNKHDIPVYVAYAGDHEISGFMSVNTAITVTGGMLASVN